MSNADSYDLNDATNMGLEPNGKPVESLTGTTKPPFDPFDKTRVRHTRYGAWDFYQEIKPPFRIQDAYDRAKPIVRTYLDGMGYFVQFLREMVHHGSTLRLLAVYILVVVLESVLPAVTLWYSSEILKTIQTALETRTVDTDTFYRNMIGMLLVNLGSEVVRMLDTRVSRALRAAVATDCTSRLLAAKLRLDLPTFESMERRLGQMERFDPWRTLSSVFQTLSIALHLISQCGVLVVVILEHRSMVLYVFFRVAQSFIPASYDSLLYSTWAARTTSEPLLDMKGIERAAVEKQYRQEIVTNNLQHYFLSKWNSASRLVELTTDSFHEVYSIYTASAGWHHLLPPIVRVSSELVLFYQILKAPSTLPTSYAAFQLTQQVTTNLNSKIGILKYSLKVMGDTLHNTKEFFELPKLQNQVKDGSIPFPENQQRLQEGVSIEFRNVSFKYPKSDSYALKNISFKIEQGQLCVIVGTNGSGKSTMLKLLLRLYDPTDGDILLNGIDIRTLKLADLRETVSVLFQDFTLLPFTVRHNIALGSPSHAEDNDMVERAADLAGASSLIERMPKKYDSFISKPIYDTFHNLPTSTTTLFGVKDLSYGLHGTGWSRESNTLSGGETQRLALARTFMRHIGEDNKVAMLLFDEPSAALDPEAEYALFERLVHLRGSKTMMFSSHRFGNLTKHANIILYMKDAEVLERGTHRELLKLEGGYASMYNIQADAFKPDDA